MQFPYAVGLRTGGDIRQFVVTANDRRHGFRRARRMARVPGVPGDPVFAYIRELTPQTSGTWYLPRVNGQLLDAPPCATEDEAVEVAAHAVAASCMHREGHQ